MLARFPGLRATLKTLYQRGNYLLHRDASFKYWTADGVNLRTPSQLAGVPEPDPAIAEFYGYFDASPWSPDGQFYMVHHVPHGGPEAGIVLYDFKEGTRRQVATTPTWTWQQGAMGRWTMFRGRLCLGFNTVNDGMLGTMFLSPDGQAAGFLSQPLQAVNEVFGLLYSINYRRLAFNKTEYGYAVRTKNLPPDLPLESDGIWVTDVASGETRLAVSLATLVHHRPRPEVAHSAHEINHLAVAPDGRRVIFVHRYRGRSGQFSRLYVAAKDGANPVLLLDEDMVSHYTWLSNRIVLAWARTKAHGDRYHLVDVETGVVEALPTDSADRWGDGHPTHHSGSHRVVTDSYPDRRRQQHLFELDTSTFNPKVVATFLLPLKFHGDRRIDLHPRWHPDGSAISVDAGHSGVRRNYIVRVPSLADSLLAT